ncbi:MAG: hypothetical protein GX042_06105 [Bacteroidales bacterium]|jgi:hypothetical protein|nr:hypothetical protein [Bacteroidales bacterium]
MKKGFALLLTAIMLLTVIQPVLSLHLCMDTLFSVGFFVEADSDACCDEPMEANCHTTPGEDKTQKGSSSDINVYHEDCCELRTIEIATDEFGRDAEQQSTLHLTQLNSATWAVIHSLLHPVIPDNALTVTRLFPPVGLSRITTDLLTLICIFRI